MQIVHFLKQIHQFTLLNAEVNINNYLALTYKISSGYYYYNNEESLFPQDQQ